MLAQCSLIGQGCAGHHYCHHCDAHKENRHLPFELFNHHVDLAKVQTQQENRLWPFFSALESFFFAGLSEWNLKKIWKIQKNYSHTNSEWF
jgi:hypothetical protein